MTFYEILQDLNLVVVLGVFFLALKVLRKGVNCEKFKILFLVLSLSALIETFTTLTYYTQNSGLHNINNVLGLYNIYNFVIFILYFFLFNKLLQEKYKTLIIWFVVIYTLSSILEGVYLIDLWRENQTYAFILASIFLSIIVILYFIRILSEGSLGLLLDNLYFWLSCGLLIVHLGNIPFRVVLNVFSFVSEVDYLDEVDYLFFCIRSLLTTLMFILIGVGLYRQYFKNEV